jgi:hypothetical protein
MGAARRMAEYMKDMLIESQKVTSSPFEVQWTEVRKYCVGEPQEPPKKGQGRGKLLASEGGDREGEGPPLARSPPLVGRVGRPGRLRLRMWNCATTS